VGESGHDPGPGASLRLSVYCEKPHSYLFRARMETEIPNTALDAAQVPRSAGDLAAVTAFARSFDGYAHWGERCGSRTDGHAAAFHESGTLPGDLSALRACLFYEQGRMQWSDGDPDGRQLTWIQALLDAIRARVPA
jgi:hypothetical protein